MSTQDDLTQFLMSRRAKLDLEQTGLPDFGGRRRVPGLRREEVALLAGMSVEYYKRLERGNAKGVSEAVVDGVSRALQLDDAEHTHLNELIRSANTGTRPYRRRPARSLRTNPVLQQTLDAMSTVPVFVQNGRLDAVAANRLGKALFLEMFSDSPQPVNAARFVFLDPKAQLFYQDWESNARQIVALLRVEAGRSPYDRRLSDLVGELSTRSDFFRRLWGAHDVREHRTGVKSIHHPIVGDLDLNYIGLELATDKSLHMLVFSAQPGSPSHDGLQLLANWANTHTVEPATVSPSASDIDTRK
ncbi:Helix-turn-helix domain-containing protein [Arthrobacter sp. cf158]|uniref:helix-turn-helix transcriptional regulator n=1 Tax=Arthrobacter sp. cf158 TaxID=1761744 RepID=UPI0008966E38|nr:helix-turn-helix transcriptional regulator [Arthrobacter sp. cf158]SDW58825.1 Helix-turn-helix domain-containing protein [Arthrobacter sp. cf158]